MTAVHSDHTTADSTDPQSTPDEFQYPRAGYILTGSDDISDQGDLVGTCIEFPSGRIAAEIDRDYAESLPANRHFHFRDAERATAALTDGTDAEYVWIEWA